MSTIIEGQSATGELKGEEKRRRWPVPEFKYSNRVAIRKSPRINIRGADRSSGRLALMSVQAGEFLNSQKFFRHLARFLALIHSEYFQVHVITLESVSFTPKGLDILAQGCRFGLPWVQDTPRFQP